MPAPQTTTGTGSDHAESPVLFLHAENTFAADPRWLESLQPLDAVLYSHAALPGVKRTSKGIDHPGALVAELQAAHPGQPVILLRAGMALEPASLATLVEQAGSAGGPDALTALSNATPRCNPFAGLQADEAPGLESMGDAVALMGRRRIHPWPWFPQHLLALSPRACAAIAERQPDSDAFAVLVEGLLGIIEWLFVADTRSPRFTAPRLDPHERRRPAPWGELSRHLQSWIAQGAPEPGFDPSGERPVTLHVTHSWGGGVSLWTRSFIATDTSSDHLQLRSEGVQSGDGHGQKLALYAGNELSAPIATWWLQPPIRSVDAQNAQYAEALQSILARFRVGRLLVSSLVGHSLDALATGLPTLQVLHDHFPAWPLLSVHPEGYLSDDAPPDLARALASRAGRLEFGDRDAAGWAAVRDAYFDALQEHGVRLVAPSRSVIDISRRLDRRMQRLDMALIPHGLPATLPPANPVRARPRDDGRLRLVIPGRIQPGKGKDLLLEALPRLTQTAQVYLLGAGKHGEDFFGLPGVSVVLQYEHEALGGLLADIGPHAAALLSVVPETFSYMLTELQQFAVPVIATRRGSFAERIEHGRTGWLIEPEAGELVAAIEHFHQQPASLEALGRALGEQPSGSLADMVAAYNERCPAQGGRTLPVTIGLGLDSAQAATNASESVASDAQVAQQREARVAAEREAARRTEWAEQADRAFRRIERRNAELQVELEERERWARQANAEVETARERVQDLERTLDERTAWAERLNHTIEQEREQQQSVRASLEAELEDARSHFQAASAQLEQANRQLADTYAQLEETGAQLVETGAQLAETRERLHQSRNELQAVMFEQEQTEAERQRLQDLQDLILSSLSWRITRPLRAGRRALRNAWQARVYNPARWPLLLSKLARYLVTQGPGGTLRRLQAPAQSETAGPPDTRSTSASGDAGTRMPRGAFPVPLAPETRPEAPAERPRASAAGPLPGFAPVAHPRASIVIPAFNQWAHTRQCLESLAGTDAGATFEIILVDDASTDETAHHGGRIAGISYLRNDSNSGFIASCNRGAAQARGAFIVLLNNDTEVTTGWLGRLLETFERVPEAGLVGARLVYPDGRLQECGGIVFNDGSGWNYGKYDDPDRPEYQYLREVDYCSGACIALRMETWNELGGFDTHYAPAYYEDTDLAFRVREAGMKVLVQPESTVIHHEGVTSGTDIGSGTKRFQALNREKFLERWRDRLEKQPDPITDPEDLSQVRRARDHHGRGRVLVIDATTPEPDQDSGSVRLTNLMRCFRDLGYEVTFFADNRMHAGRYTRALQRSGIEVQHLPWLDPVKSIFELRGQEFDFIFISRHYIAINYLYLVKQYCPGVPFIFDTVDLHYLREQRLAELEDSATLRKVAKQTRRSELKVIANAEATVVVSPTEVDVLRRDAPGARVHVLSNIHEVPGRRRSFAQRKDLFFVGGYQHPPNIDAARWFVGEIWPRVRERLPDVRFHLIGSKATDEVRALAGDGVEFHGFVEDLEPWLDGCRMAVAPLRYGAGVKGKVNMSMSYGQPVVATPAAVEGMFAEHGREVLVAATAEAFATEIVRLYSDADLWQRLSDASIRNVQQHFSLEAARNSLSELLGRLDATD